MSRGDIDLSIFGWDGCIIPSDSKTLCRSLPRWENLKSFRTPQTSNGCELYFPNQFMTAADGTKYMPGYIKGETIDDGGYAQIFKGRRGIFKSIGETNGTLRLEKQAPFMDVCIKEVHLNITPEEDAAPDAVRKKAYEDEINAILYEAFLHALLYKTLEKEGYPSAVPHLYEVIANTNGKSSPVSLTDCESIWINMELIDGTTLEKYLRKHLIPARHGHHGAAALYKSNERILLDIFVQLAFYLNILQTKLLFNHRDLKLNNLFVRYHKPHTHWSRTLSIPEFGSWTCKIDVVLIDFGFSCISCGSGFPNPRSSLVSAGSWFRSEHDCLKYGRDIALFLYSLHCTFPLRNYVSAEFFKTIHRVMSAERRGERIDMFNGFDASGTPQVHPTIPHSIKFNDGVYYFLRDSDVEVPECRPAQFFRGLAPLREALDP